MKRNTVLRSVLIPSILGLITLGCVPYQRYDNLKADYRRAKKINDDLSTKLNRMVQEYNLLKGGEGIGTVENRNLRERIAALISTNEGLEAQLEELRKGGGLEFTNTDVSDIGGGVTLDPSGSLVISEELTFNSGEAVFKSKSAQRIIDNLARVLRTNYPGEVFHIVGHTDNTPLVKTKKRWDTNWKLGFERAYSVFKYLTLQHNFREDQFVLHSYGFLKPLEPNDTKEGRARNRRVEIYRGGAKL